MGWRPDSRRTYSPPAVFQSTPPAWGGDLLYPHIAPFLSVSIPATRVGWRLEAWESDANLGVSIPATRVGWRRHRGAERPYQTSFNPRHPRGVATLLSISGVDLRMFQSPPPAWGGDTAGARSFVMVSFNPRHPRGVATGVSGVTRGLLQVSIHATRVGWRRLKKTSLSICWSFNPRHPRGVATGPGESCIGILEFQSTPPAWGGDVNNTTTTANNTFQSTPPAWGGDARFH